MFEQHPVSVAQVDPQFERRLRDLRLHAQAVRTALATGAQNLWFRPSNWAGDHFDLEGLREPFSRDAANQVVIQAISDPEHPGVSGDLVAATTMVDWLATLERAYRNRHTMGWPRMLAHAASRLGGQGATSGPYALMLAQVREEIRLAGEPQPEAP